MAKAMLIVNEAECCGKCDLSVKIPKSKYLVHCVPLKRNVHKYSSIECPLRKCPVPKDEHKCYTDEDYYRAEGYNDCIDEILGGGE